MNIKQALTTLDVENDDHWTADGLPRVETVAALVGGDVTRRDITNAAPMFMRTPGETEETGAPTENPQETGSPEPEKPEETGSPVAEKIEAGAPEPEKTEEAGSPPEVPTENPQQAAHVEIMDSVVGLPPVEVFRDVALVDRAIDEFGRQASVLTARREAIVSQLKDIGQRSAMLTSARNKLTRGGAKTRATNAIQDYLKAQQKARADRAMRARRFIEAGTTIEDVTKELGGPSKMDAAMKQRKVARGARRPVYPSVVSK